MRKVFQWPNILTRFVIVQYSLITRLYLSARANAKRATASYMLYIYVTIIFRIARPVSNNAKNNMRV